eukprot:354697-Pleurochrysis_carterae.AAC.1
MQVLNATSAYDRKSQAQAKPDQTKVGNAQLWNEIKLGEESKHAQRIRRKSNHMAEHVKVCNRRG